MSRKATSFVELPKTPDPSIAFQILDNFLSGTSFNGRWMAADHDIPIGFTRPEGFTTLSFLSEYWGADEIDIHQKELTISLYDGNYVDQGHISFSFQYDKPTFPFDVKNAYII